MPTLALSTSHEASDGKDALDFSQFLTSQVSSLQSALLEKYEEEIASLRAENQRLLGLSLAIQSGRDAAPQTIFEEVVQTAEPGLGNHQIDGVIANPPITQGIDRGLGPAASTTSSMSSKQEAKENRKKRTQEVLAAISDVELASERKPQPSLQQDASPDKKSSDSPEKTQRPPPLQGQHHQLKQSSRKDLRHAEYTTLQRIVFSQSFEVGSGCIILANTLMMALKLQYDAIDIGYRIGSGNFLRDAEGTWPHAKEAFYWIELGFTAVFIIEYFIRIAALKLQSFCSGWMWFDGIVITVGAVDTFAASALPVNPGMLRVLRLVRLVRLFKILKSMQAFDSLFLLQKAIVASMNAAIWSFAILVAVQLVVGLFLNQVMQTFLMQDHHSLQAKQEVYKYFGTFTGTMLTMFEITMASWVKPCRCLVDNVNELFILFFILYRCFFCFAVLKVIAAVFITETNRVLQHDDELTLMKIQREKALFDSKVRRIISAFAGDTIGWHELEQLASDKDVKAHLSTFGFHPKDLEKLFWLIDDGTGRVPINTFLKKVGGLKGQAKAIDVLTALKLLRKVDSELSHGLSQMGYLQINQAEEEIEDHCCSLLNKSSRSSASQPSNTPDEPSRESF